MPTKYTHHLTPGTFVRLTLDAECSSPGVVVDFDHIRGIDNVEFVNVDFHPDGDDSATSTLPVTILTPLCSWIDEYPDGFGLACSEPGVPTTISIPCQHDATKRFAWVNQFGSFDDLFCTEHALTASLDCQRDHEPFEVHDVDDDQAVAS